MKYAIIGAGAMGGAIAEGLLKSGACAPQEMTVSNPSAGKLKKFSEAGAAVTSDNVKAVESGAGTIVVAVKPWLVEQVLKEIAPVLDAGRQSLLICAAGVSGAAVQAALGDKKNASIFIIMPNTAISIGASMTFIVPVNADEAAAARVREVFAALGDAMVITEKQLPAATALASCGIAYAMRYVRAASEGGVELGFKADLAEKIVLQTMQGAVGLLQATGNHPEAEIDKVTTPGGVTIKGLNAMEEAGFTNAVIRGLKASVK